MDMSGITPPCMDWDSTNLPEAWERFKRHVELIFTGPLSSKSEIEKVSYLLLWIGDKGRDVHQAWTLTEAEKKSLKSIYKKFQAHVQPKLNPIFARFRFYNEVQGADTIDKFVTRLRLRSRDCKFNANEDEMIRDRIVFGTNNSRIREKLINEGEKLTLDKALQIAQSFEYCQTQMATMNLTSTQTDTPPVTPTPVDAIHRRNGRKPPPDNHQQQRQPPQQRQQQRSYQRYEKSCDNCGRVHGPTKTQCPAFGKLCNKCQKQNHFGHMCRSNQNYHKSVHDIDASAVDGACGYSCDTPEYYIDMVSTRSLSQSPDRAFVPITLGPSKVPIHFKIDTGSECNIVSHETFKRLKLSAPLEPPDSKLTSYSGDLLKVLGKNEEDVLYLWNGL
ncbi:uncharacterized protein LOC128207393 [Mya arenaria]|uniref:uncharacterized protein LOC128207393 n=2 Tax=Mya arenaria TaxID=6604 RepID=UPI0022E8EEB5|nr:uncharacterized protein LOC128207393 [Mya arenaria]